MIPKGNNRNGGAWPSYQYQFSNRQKVTKACEASLVNPNAAISIMPTVCVGAFFDRPPKRVPLEEKTAPYCPGSLCVIA